MYPNGKHPEPVPDEEIEGREEVGAFLRQWHAPAPHPAAKAQLLELLVAKMPAVQTKITATRPTPRFGAAWAWLILRSQTRLVHPATWAASGLVIALGALVTLAFYQPSQAGTELPFVLVAPLVAACGVAFLYGIEADPALELQLATPISPRVILLARLALLFGFNLGITLACSVVLTLAQVQISLVPLIAAWLAPMTFLSALAFLLSVLFFDSLASVLVSLLLWAGVTLRHFIELPPIFVPDLLHANFYPVMLLSAPALVLLALVIAEREERWAGGAR
jgi:hypothetical protein